MFLNLVSLVMGDSAYDCPRLEHALHHNAGGILGDGYHLPSMNECYQVCRALPRSCRYATYNKETSACQLIGGLNDVTTVPEDEPEWTTCANEFFAPSGIDNSMIGTTNRRAPSRAWQDDFDWLELESFSSPKIVTNNFINSNRQTCEAVRKLYPMRSHQFPRFRSGQIPKSCEYFCLEKASDGLEINYDALDECTFDCPPSYERDSGISWIGGAVIRVAAYCRSYETPESQVLFREPKLLALRLRTELISGRYTDKARPAITTLPFYINVTIMDCNMTIPQVEGWHGPDRNPHEMFQDIQTAGYEAYRMIHLTSERTIHIYANTMFGALHALMSFENMLGGYNRELFTKVNQTSTNIALPEAMHLHQGDDLIYGLPYGDFDMYDWPIYPYRSLLIDTGRSFLSNTAIYRVIDQMSKAKLNVLHWQITGNQSFPLALGTEEICAMLDGKLQCDYEPNNDVVITLHNTKWNLTDYMHGSDCHKSGSLARGNCASALGAGAIYTKTDIATILAHAWLNGIQVVFEIPSPGNARSWGVGEANYCDRWLWNRNHGSSSQAGNHQDDKMYSCPYMASEYDGPSSTLSIMCRGLQYQTPDYCDKPVCGQINLRVFERNGEFVSKRPSSIFQSIIEALSRPIAWETTWFKMSWTYFNTSLGNMDIAKIFQICDVDGHCEPSKYINPGDFFHVGLNTLSDECLGKELTDTGSLKWSRFVIDAGLEKQWKIIAWHKGLTRHPELMEDYPDIVPQITSSDDESFKAIQKGLRQLKRYIWSDTQTLGLSCGQGNTVATGVGPSCTPYQSFWDVYNIDPDLYTIMALPRTANDELHAFGATAVLMGDAITNINVSDVIFPRAAALGGALWTGRRDRETPLFSNPLQTINDVLDTFDYSTLNSRDFQDELEWVKWSYARAKECFGTYPGKALYCGISGSFGDLTCTHFTQQQYDTLYWDKNEYWTRQNGYGRMMIAFPISIVITTLLFL